MEMSDDVLVVEDDPGIQRMLRLALRSQGYGVIAAQTGEVGLSLAQANAPSVVLLDLGLPDCDGIDLLGRLARVCDAPVIVVTARDQESQKVSALDAGAVDYVVKPFGMAELMARIRVALRRGAQHPAQGGVYEADGLRVDRDARTVTLDGAALHLTPNEFALLTVLIDNRGKALTHRRIQHEVWGYPTTDDYKTLRVLMASLRRKLGDRPSDPRFVRTEVGVGYRFVGGGA